MSDQEFGIDIDEETKMSEQESDNEVLSEESVTRKVSKQKLKPKASKRKSKVKKTDESEANRLHTCEHCGKQFKTKWYAALHSKSCQLNSDKDEEDSESELQCDLCGNLFSNKHCLRSHKLYCQVPKLTCSVCDAKFTRQHDLKRHVTLTHLKMKEIECELCLKRFGRNSHLRRHMANVHKDGKMRMVKSKSVKSPSDQATTGVRCPHEDCGSTLKNMKYLKRHLIESHPDPDDKDQMLMCPFNRICSSRFTRYRNLMVHVSTTHRHLFEDRELLQKFTTLKVPTDNEINQSEQLSSGSKGKKERRELRCSNLEERVIEIEFDSLINDGSYA